MPVANLYAKDCTVKPLTLAPKFTQTCAAPVFVPGLHSFNSVRVVADVDGVELEHLRLRPLAKNSARKAEFTTQ